MKYLLTLFALLITTTAFCQGQFQKETAGSLTYVSGHVMQLAKAIPAEKYSYSPGQWRSVGGRGLRPYYFSELFFCLQARC